MRKRWRRKNQSRCGCGCGCGGGREAEKLHWRNFPRLEKFGNCQKKKNCCFSATETAVAPRRQQMLLQNNYFCFKEKKNILLGNSCVITVLSQLKKKTVPRVSATQHFGFCFLFPSEKGARKKVEGRRTKDKSENKKKQGGSASYFPSSVVNCSTLVSHLCVTSAFTCLSQCRFIAIHLLLFTYY